MATFAAQQANPDALGTSIVGGRGQAEIAKLSSEFAQEFGRFRQRLHWVERIVQ
jgi:hypothetical protein